MAYCGVNFLDKINNQLKTGTKYDSSECFSVKLTLGYKFANLPYFQDGELKITETATIMRYIAANHKPELPHVNNSHYLVHAQIMVGIVDDIKGASGAACYSG